MDKIAHDKLGAIHTAPIVAVLEQRFDETFKRLAEGWKNICTLGVVPLHG